MSNQSEMPPNHLRLHINDLQDILASIALDQSADVESVWYEYWDCILNYWTRRSSDGTTRLSVAPQRQLIREILVDKTEVDVGHDWSYEADAGDTSMERVSDQPRGLQERIDEARAGVDTESRIPDFVADQATGRHVSLSRVTFGTSNCYTGQICFRLLRHVLAIIAFGDSWSMYRFPRDELARLYIKHVIGFKDNDTFDPEKAPKQPKTVDISKYVVIPFSKVLKANGSNYSNAFEKAIGLITADLKASMNPTIVHEAIGRLPRVHIITLQKDTVTERMESNISSNNTHPYPDSTKQAARPTPKIRPSRGGEYLNDEFKGIGVEDARWTMQLPVSFKKLVRDITVVHGVAGMGNSAVVVVWGSTRWGVQFV
ncbi:hypothetical protein L210DRAFT_3502613 [Boletus edulis BED1]|uniref:Uncharacterized protein n=1 Tax=Boletus edulis BED1 TaxID=1328754 RepID=A0AAD4BZE2_BOLED|nr:hypothetical protein L210DRAFT_3502613 [Boletus edulis BED1]